MRKRYSGWARKLARRLRALEARESPFTKSKARQNHAYNPEAEARRRDEDLLARRRP